MSEILAHIESLFARHHETLVERIKHAMSDALAQALQPIVDNQTQIATDIANLGSLMITTLSDIQTEINSIPTAGTISAENRQTINNLVTAGQDAHNSLQGAIQTLMRADAEAKAATGSSDTPSSVSGSTASVSGAGSMPFPPAG